MLAIAMREWREDIFPTLPLLRPSHMDMIAIRLEASRDWCLAQDGNEAV